MAFAMVSFVTYAISILTFIIYKAVSFTEFSEAALFFMVALLHISFYTISVTKREKIFNFMESLEAVIQISKKFVCELSEK